MPEAPQSFLEWYNANVERKQYAQAYDMQALKAVMPFPAPAPPPAPLDPELYMIDTHGEKRMPPQYPGWTVIRRSEAVRRGDVYTCWQGSPAKHPKDASVFDFGHWGRSFDSLVGQSRQYVGYRPERGALPGNRHYSEPLSLP